jgi:hypothetical protein
LLPLGLHVLHLHQRQTLALAAAVHCPNAAVIHKAEQRQRKVAAEKLNFLAGSCHPPPSCLQTGLFQLVHDFPVVDFKTNVLALAATAKLYGMPTILTSSLEGVSTYTQQCHTYCSAHTPSALLHEQEC